jgi:hypothetical protein
MRDKDAKILMEKYSFIREEQDASGNKDQVGQQVAGKFNELLPSWQKTAEQFKAEYSALKTPEEQEKFFKEKVLPAINSATQQSSQQGQGQQQAPQQQLNQSYQYIEDIINEGWFDRLKSRASGAYGALQGAKPGDTSGKATDYQTGKINKRFEILQNTIGKQLKELQRDLGTTKNSDPETKKRVADLITSLDSTAGIKPVETTLGNVAHAAGRVQELIGKGILAAPFVMVSGAIAGLTGATGMAYGAIKGGISGATIYAVKTLLDGKQPTTKGTALAAGAGAAIGAATMGIIDNFDKIKQAFNSLGNLNPFGHGTGAGTDVPHFRVNPQLAPDTSGLQVQGNPNFVAPGTTHVTPSVTWDGQQPSAPTPSGDEFRAETGTSYNPVSHLDQGVDHIYKALDAKGIMGTTGPHHELVASPNFTTAVDKAFPHLTSKTAEKIANLIANTDPAQLQQLQHGGQNAVINFLKTAARH